MNETVWYKFDEWLDKFKPVNNHIDDSHGFNGCLFETYGEEVDYINSLSENNTAWTLFEEDGVMYLVNGVYLVNRLGYLITENNYLENDLIYVKFEEVAA
jgi:hypothetical protein